MWPDYFRLKDQSQGQAPSCAAKTRRRTQHQDKNIGTKDATFTASSQDRLTG